MSSRNKNKRDYYDALGVEKNASSDEIKRAYRKLAMKYHPDRNKEATAESKFKEIQEAYSVLGDEEKRGTYDRYGFDGGAFEGFGGDGFSGFGDIFDMFFGGSGGRSRRRGSQQRRQQYGEDVEVKVDITLKDVISGVKKEIKYNRYIPCDECNGTGGSTVNCDRCNGRGQVEQVTSSLFGRVMQVTTCPVCRGEGKKISVKCDHCNGKKVLPELKDITPNIPPGVEHGMMLKVQGQGHIPSKNAVPGDLLVLVRIKKHPEFERSGTSILSSSSITFLQAIKGGKINVKTIDGNIKLNIPSGTQSGTEFRLKNKGLPQLNRPNLRGYQYITVDVENPKYEALSMDAKKKIDELSTIIPAKNVATEKRTQKKYNKKK